MTASDAAGLEPAPSTRREAVLRLDLLGSPQLVLADRPVVPRTRKTLALLAYLAIQGGPQPREHLADLFWPDADIDDARASLRTTLSYVRQALGSDVDAHLVTTREFVALHPSGPIDLDVQGLAEPQQLTRRTPEASILRHQIEDAVARYRGPFLEGLSLPDAPDFETWVESQRAHWRGVAAELLECLATMQLQDGDAGAALTTLERWTEVERDEESAWLQLIELHLRCEDRPGARRAWKSYSEVLADLDAQPSKKMNMLAERIDGIATTSAHSATSDTPAGPRGLDVHSLPLVGRSQEWSALLAAFERSCLGRPEVVVVEGAAGLGKTRLISEFTASVASIGADIIMGRALDTISELPFAAVVDALRARLEDENAPDDLLSDIWLAEIARLLPELGERYPDLSLLAYDPTFARGRLFEAVARLVQALAERTPLVLCLDDVQWTDVATRDLLRYAIRRWTDSRTPILIILAIRSEDLDMDLTLAQWIASLGRDARTTDVSMQLLQRDDVVALLTHLSDSAPFLDDGTHARILLEFGTWLAGKTGGHPLSLTQSIDTLLQTSVLHVRPGGQGNWKLEIPDVGYAEQFSRLDSEALTGMSSGTIAGVRTSATTSVSAARHGQTMYPLAAVHELQKLVPAG